MAKPIRTYPPAVYSIIFRGSRSYPPKEFKLDYNPLWVAPDSIVTVRVYTLLELFGNMSDIEVHRLASNNDQIIGNASAYGV